MEEEKQRVTLIELLMETPVWMTNGKSYLRYDRERKCFVIATDGGQLVAEHVLINQAIAHFDTLVGGV